MKALSKMLISIFILLSLLTTGCGSGIDYTTQSSASIQSAASSDQTAKTDSMATSIAAEAGITASEIAAVKAENSKPVEVLPVDISTFKDQPVADHVYKTNLDVYLRDVDSGVFYEECPGIKKVPYLDVIVYNEKSAKAWRIGQIKVDQHEYGTISLIDDKTLCYNNYSQLSFIDFEQGKKIGFKLAFQKPSQPNYNLCGIAFDQAKKQYSLIYAVSSYQTSSDGIYRSWMMFDNSDIGTTDAHIELQRFSADGKFIDKHVTTI